MSCPSWLRSLCQCQVADQECLPFKMIYALQHEQVGLRMMIGADACHSHWNDIKNSLRRSNMQRVLLLGTILNNVAHGPYKSGRNSQTLQEAVAHYSESISIDEFQDLVEMMAMDKKIDADHESLPTCPEDLPNLECFTRLPIFVNLLT